MSFPSRAGYLDEDQMEVLLERAQTEVFSIKQKLDNDLKQEKKTLRQKLIMKRRRETLQKVSEELRCYFFAHLSAHPPSARCPGMAIRELRSAWRAGRPPDVPSVVG